MRRCPSCSAPLEDGVSFCSECGTKLQAAAKPMAKNTMLGVSPEALAALARAATAKGAAAAAPDPEPESDAGRSTNTGITEPPRGQMGRTVLGMTPPPATLAAAAAAAAQAAAGPGRSRSAAGPSGKALAKTMFGVGASVAPPSATPPAPQGFSAAGSTAGSPAAAPAAAPAATPAAQPAAKGTQKTMFAGGAQGPSAQAASPPHSTPLAGAPAAAAAAAAPASGAPLHPLAEPGSRPPPRPDPSRTSFGVADTPVAPEAPARPAAARNPKAAHTLLGLEDDAPEVAASTRSPSPRPPPLARREPTAAPASVWDQIDGGGGREPYVKAESTVPPVRSGISAGKVLAVLGLLLAAAALAVLAMLKSGPEVRVRVASDAGRDTLEFEVPGAQAGTKLRFGGLEQPLSAGRATFALGADAIRVGENVVLYDLVEPDGAVESGKITLSVDYRVTLDSAPLRAGKAAVDVVVAAHPGSQVWLDGQPLALDAQGRAVRSDPVELSASASELEHVVRYRVQPPAGEATVGELRTVLSVTRLSIDRPGSELVTDREVVEIAGEVEPGATVTIDGAAVAVRQNRFLHRYPLPAPGELRPLVVAMAEGKAPRAITLRLRRVADLVEAAKGFSPNASVSYAKLAQNPAIYRGQKVELEGRVYNVSVDAGHSALQVLVRSCPSGKRCPLWVSYPAATDLTVDSWVRVLGTVEGEQAFVSETGEQKRVPKVQAAFLLPAKP